MTVCGVREDRRYEKKYVRAVPTTADEQSLLNTIHNTRRQNCNSNRESLFRRRIRHPNPYHDERYVELWELGGGAWIFVFGFGCDGG